MNSSPLNKRKLLAAGSSRVVGRPRRESWYHRAGSLPGVHPLDSNMMNVVKLAFCMLLIAVAAPTSSAQTSGVPSYKAPDYRPRVPATTRDVVGHFTQSGDPQVDVWFAHDGTARIRFANAQDAENLGSTHEYAARWTIRNGWVDLTFDFGEVVLEFDPDTQTLTAKHSLRSVLLLRFQTLSKVEAS